MASLSARRRRRNRNERQDSPSTKTHPIQLERVIREHRERMSILHPEEFPTEPKHLHQPDHIPENDPNIPTEEKSADYLLRDAEDK